MDIIKDIIGFCSTVQNVSCAFSFLTTTVSKAEKIFIILFKLCFCDQHDDICKRDYKLITGYKNKKTFEVIRRKLLLPRNEKKCVCAS